MDRRLDEVMSSVFMFVGNNKYNGNLKNDFYIYLTVSRGGRGTNRKVRRSNRSMGTRGDYAWLVGPRALLVNIKGHKRF